MNKLSYDLHIHSCLSPCADDDMTPGNIVGMASLTGLDIIAITDHNSCKNCSAALKAAEDFGILVIPGMELTTMEEVHVLCYFECLADALAFDAYVAQHILPIPNQSDVFGNQLLCDDNDSVCGTFDILLISATDISFFELYDLLKEYRGFMVPAHIDKQTNSLLYNLGFIPENSMFTCCEVRDLTKAEELIEKHTYLKQCRIISNSDAHQLTGLHESIYYLQATSGAIPDILNALAKSPS